MFTWVITDYPSKNSFAYKIFLFKLLTDFTDLALGQSKLAFSKSMLEKNQMLIENSQTAGVTTYMNKTPIL